MIYINLYEYQETEIDKEQILCNFGAYKLINSNSITSKDTYLFGVVRSKRNFFTYMETSPLAMDVCNFLPILDTHYHMAVRVFKTATPTVSYVYLAKKSHL